MDSASHDPPGAGFESGFNDTSVPQLTPWDATFWFLPLVTILGFIIPAIYLFPPVPASKADALGATHTRLGLRHEDSNLRDQFSRRHQSNPAAKSSPRPKLQALSIYPIKSCRGIELSRSRVLATGLEFDRLYTFAQLKSPFPLPANEEERKEKEEKGEGHTWHFITQRQFALLATVKVDVWVPREDQQKAKKNLGGGGGGAGAAGSHEDDGGIGAWIVLRFPWKDLGFRGVLQTVAAKMGRGWRATPEKEILLPAGFPSEADIAARGYEYADVKIWKEVVNALNMGAELPEELRLYLGVSNKLALFRVDPGRFREVYRCAPRKGEAGYQPIVGFQDAYPLHMMSLSSLQDFDSKITKDEELKQLDVRRFRSNIILSGSQPYDEESWKLVRFHPGTSKLTAEAEFHVSCRTVRCKLPNVDPRVGIRHRVEPDRSLRKHRNVDAGAPYSGCLGMQLCPLFEEAGAEIAGADGEVVTDDELRSWLEVGMEVEVLRRGEHKYVEQ